MQPSNKNAKGALETRRINYVKTFKNEPGNRVLEDLAGFCRANETCFHENDRAHAVLEGRREVWLRIQHHLNLSPDEIWKLYARQ